MMTEVNTMPDIFFTTPAKLLQIVFFKLFHTDGTQADKNILEYQNISSENILLQHLII